MLQTGQLHTYLAALPVINSAWGCCLAYCTSLQELAVMDVLHKGSQSRITIPTEPAFLALGPNHLAVGMNNKVPLTIKMQVYHVTPKHQSPAQCCYPCQRDWYHSKCLMEGLKLTGLSQMLLTAFCHACWVCCCFTTKVLTTCQAVCMMSQSSVDSPSCLRHNSR